MSGNPEVANGTPSPNPEHLAEVRKSSVFISYTRRERDLEVAKALERGLRAAGVGVWRDESQLLMGQQWPTELGKALEGCDGLVLVWSKHSAASEYVEREWNAAFALKKVILPVRLDDTPLPVMLRGSHFVDASDAEAAVPRILAAFKGVDGTGEVEGAGSSKKPARARWMAGGALAVVTLVAGVLVAERMGTQSPSESRANPPEARAEVQSLAGLIRDEEGEPVANVEVSLPSLGTKTLTDANGYFHLRASAENQATVSFMARKEGYETYEAHATLGNTGLGFTMTKR